MNIRKTFNAEGDEIYLNLEIAFDRQDSVDKIIAALRAEKHNLKFHTGGKLTVCMAAVVVPF